MLPTLLRQDHCAFEHGVRVAMIQQANGAATPAIANCPQMPRLSQGNAYQD
jgi:hypothetical protein